jgi:hypothetical protein
VEKSLPSKLHFGLFAPLQGTYRVTHQQLREGDVFIVPVGPETDGPCYEAVFSVRRDDACA